MLDNLPKLEEWSRRKYGRNLLYFWGGPIGEGDDEDDEDEGEDGDKDGSGEVEEV